MMKNTNVIKIKTIGMVNNRRVIRKLRKFDDIDYQRQEFFGFVDWPVEI